MRRFRSLLCVVLGCSLVAACGGSDGSDDAPSGQGIIDGPVGQWAWYDIPGAICANGSETGLGVNQGSGSQVVIYMSGGSACLNETCSIGTPSMRKDGGFKEPQLLECVDGPDCDGGVTFPGASIFNRSAPMNPFADATYVYISNCAGDYYVGDAEHVFPSWTAKFQGRRNQTLFAAEVAASFPDASRVIVSGGSAGSVGAIMNYWQWVKAFPDTRVDLISDSFAFVKVDSPQYRYDLHKPQAPDGCSNCVADYRTVYEFNAGLSSKSRIAVIDSEDNWTLDLASGYQYTQGLQALQTHLEPIPSLRYYIANGSRHILMQYALDSAETDVQATSGGTHFLGEFLTKMQSDDPSWENLTCLQSTN